MEVHRIAERADMERGRRTDLLICTTAPFCKKSLSQDVRTMALEHRVMNVTVHFFYECVELSL